MSREVGKLEEMNHPKVGRYFRGHVVSATFSGRIRLMPAERRNERSPDFAIEMQTHDGGALHVGAAWWQRSEGQDFGLPYLSMSISGPGLPELRCAGFAESDQDFKKEAPEIAKAAPPCQGRNWRLVWNAPKPKPATVSQPVAAIHDDIPF
ncbi:DUF736 family protein [Algihabitans albus]|uniref:DUF736 family protein n=1 Tax=Algihabitans albus TaxID=2164067 RepID=UPI0035CEB13D